MPRLRLLLTLIIAGVLTLPLHAATITVAGDGADYTSIQAAINAANNGDEIIVSPGPIWKTSTSTARPSLSAVPAAIRPIPSLQ